MLNCFIRKVIPSFIKDSARYLLSIIEERKYSKTVLQLSASSKYILFFTDTARGGVGQYVKNYLTEKKKQRQNILFVCNRGNGLDGKFPFYYVKQLDYAKDVCETNENVRVYRDFAQIVTLYGDYVSEVFVNSVLGIYDWNKILNGSALLAKQKSLRLIYLIHSYNCVCPTSVLMRKGAYCGLDCKSNRCSKKTIGVTFEKYDSIEQWQSEWLSFLKECDEIRIFDNSAKAILQTVYPSLHDSQFVCVPHQITDFTLKAYTKQCKELVVGICGSITNEFKGMYVVRDFLKCCEKRDIKVVVAGDLHPSCKVQASCIVYTGRYEAKELDAILEENGVNIAFFTSICPETFSYTVSELMMMGLPIACFNVGAQGERVRKYAKGIILPINACAEDILECLTHYFNREMIE